MECFKAGAKYDVEEKEQWVGRYLEAAGNCEGKLPVTEFCKNSQCPINAGYLGELVRMKLRREGLSAPKGMVGSGRGIGLVKVGGSESSRGRTLQGEACVRICGIEVSFKPGIGRSDAAFIIAAAAEAAR